MEQPAVEPPAKLKRRYFTAVSLVCVYKVLTRRAARRPRPRRRPGFSVHYFRVTTAQAG